VKLSLIENANSFLVESLKKALEAESDPHQWKFAILTLVQAIELALKERLRKEHPFLIFVDIDRPINTVGIEKAASRLQSVAGLTLKDSDLKNIKTATKIRNFIVHHEFELNIDQTKAVYSRLLGFASDFYSEHLEEKMSSILPPNLWQEAVEIDVYLTELSLYMTKIRSHHNRRRYIQFHKSHFNQLHKLSDVFCS